MKKYCEIVLTGASASGKTSSLAFLSRELSDRGVRVIACPEAATIVLSSGLGEVPLNREQYPERFRALQKSILLLNFQMRQHMRDLAEQFDEPVLILYDRGEMDVRAYAGQEIFDGLLKEQGWSVEDMRDAYDAVIHLTSVAVDFPESYSNDNNPARWESPEQARQSDQDILQAWTGAPRLWVVDNDHRLEGKLERVLDIAMHTMGMPYHREHEFRFLLSEAPLQEDLLQQGARPVEIEQHYISGAEGEFRLRARGSRPAATFYHTVKHQLEDGTRYEQESRISRDEYERLLEAAGDYRVLRKTRWCFAQQGHYYELDQIDTEDREIWILEVEVLPGDDHPLLPDWLKVEKDVSQETAFSSRSLAK